MGPTLAAPDRARRWSARASTVPAIQRELAALWSTQDLTTEVDGVRQRTVAARTSVMNLVVVASGPEDGERAAGTIHGLAGHLPSRTLVIVPGDPDGPSTLRARVEAFCVLPHHGEAEICAELIHLEPGGETGRHLESVIAPLLVHDLPVTVWWVDEPRFGRSTTGPILALADRLIVDGSGWRGDGLARLRELALHQAASGVAVSDFALMRQSRWREAIASVFDMPDLLPYLAYIRRIAVMYAAGDEDAPGTVNLVKPVYHVAWLGSRLGLRVATPLAPRLRSGGTGGVRRAGRPAHPAVHDGRLHGPHGEVRVTLGPAPSELAPGTTLQVELLAERRGSELRATVTADANAITVRAWLDGVALVDRAFLAPRRTELDLLEEAIELGVTDRIGAATVGFAAALVSERIAGEAGSEEPPSTPTAAADTRATDPSTAERAPIDPGGDGRKETLR